MLALTKRNDLQAADAVIELMVREEKERGLVYHMAREFMENLDGRLSFNLFEDELVHRKEHSVEFQVVYLQHVLRDCPEPPRIAPLLVGSFHDLLDNAKPPIKDTQVAEFVRDLLGRPVAPGLLQLAEFLVDLRDDRVGAVPVEAALGRVVAAEDRLAQGRTL